MRTRQLIVPAAGLVIATAVPSYADVNLVLHDSIAGQSVVDQTVTVPVDNVDATAKAGNADASTSGVCVTGLDLTMTSPLGYRHSGVGVACVGRP